MDRLGKTLSVTGDQPRVKGDVHGGDISQGAIPLWGEVVASYCLSKV